MPFHPHPALDVIVQVNELRMLEVEGHKSRSVGLVTAQDSMQKYVPSSALQYAPIKNLCTEAIVTKLNRASHVLIYLHEGSKSYLNSPAFPETSSPMIKPKRPRTELKISMTRILTNLL